MKFPVIACWTAILLCTTTSLAQKPGGEDGYGIFNNQQEYYQFMGNVKNSLAGVPDMESMVLMINDAVLNQPFGSSSEKYGGNSGTLGMLSNADVRKDLEMVESQYEELKSLNAQIQQRMADQLRNLDFGDKTDLVERIQSIRNAAADELNGVLLPHQVTRLAQLRAQQQLRYRSLVEVITSDPLKTDLEITDRQAEKLRAEERQIQEDLRREIARLRAEARQRILAKLQPAQKQEVVEMFGDFFDFDSNEQSRQKKTRKESGK